MEVFLFLIVYIMSSGQPVMEHKAFPSDEACFAAVEQRYMEVFSDPNVEYVVIAGCAPVPGQEAKAS